MDDLWKSFRDNAVVKSTIDDRVYMMGVFSILDNSGYELSSGEDISKKKMRIHFEK